MHFEHRKQEILKKIVENDKSLKGSIDHHCLSLVEYINQQPNIVTTSSCSGRISVIQQNAQNTQKKDDWLFVSHDPLSTSHAIHSLFINENCECQIDYDMMIIFKFEPFLLHVEASDLQHAKQFLTVSLDCGFRNSGIVPSERFIIGVRHTMKLDVPIGFYCREHQQTNKLVSSEYLDMLVKMSNQKFDENFRRIEMLRQKLEKLFTTEHEEQIKETKEERRIRKQREGLERQRQLSVINSQ